MKKPLLVAALYSLSGCALQLNGQTLRLGPTPASPPPVAAAQTPAAAKPAAREHSAEEKASVSGRAAAKALSALTASTAKGDALDEALLAELEKNAGEAEALLPHSGGYYLQEAAALRLQASLTRPEGVAQVTTQLGGTLLSKGDGGHDLSVPVKAEADRCYVLLGQFRSWTGQEKVSERALEAPSKAAAPQEFTLALPAGMDGQGFCAIDAGAYTLKSTSKFAGSTNGLRYVVLEFGRAALPPLISARVRLEPPDRCDAEAWDNAFLKPVPGTLAWLDREPVLLASSYAGGDSPTVVVHVGSGKSGMPQNRSLRSTPPGKVVFTEPFALSSCPARSREGGLPRGATSRKLVQCEEAIAGKYEAGWKEVDRMRAATARNDTSTVKFVNAAAEAKAEKLREAYGRDYQRDCLPILQAARKVSETHFNHLVDSLTQAPPTDPALRAETNAAALFWKAD